MHRICFNNWINEYQIFKISVSRTVVCFSCNDQFLINNLRESLESNLWSDRLYQADKYTWDYLQSTQTLRLRVKGEWDPLPFLRSEHLSSVAGEWWWWWWCRGNVLLELCNHRKWSKMISVDVCSHVWRLRRFRINDVNDSDRHLKVLKWFLTWGRGRNDFRPRRFEIKHKCTRKRQTSQSSKSMNG